MRLVVIATMFVHAEDESAAEELVLGALDVDGVSDVTCEVESREPPADFFAGWTKEMWIERRRLAQSNKGRSERSAAWANYLEEEFKTRVF